VGVHEAGLNWLGRFKTDKGRIDLKKSGLFAIVTMARTLAIRHHVVERSTLARLAGIEALGRGARPTSTRWLPRKAPFSI
jgi:CBS domain-containing protein